MGKAAVKRIFISSVQKAFARERKLLKRYIAKDPVLKRAFDTFVFEEDVVATDRRADEVYISELRNSDIYLGLIGSEYGYEDGEGVSPTEREYEIPASAVAEAIINAIAHRDYSSSGSVQVELYADRLVIRNPGNINPALTKEELFVEHSSYPNNCLIADQLYQTKHIEKFGTGFTDLLYSCRKAGLADPVVDNSRTEFVITIKRNPSGVGGKETTNKQQIKKIKNSDIIALIVENPTLSIEKLAKKQQITVSMLRTKIESFKKLGILKRVGSRKNGRWVFTSKFGGCSADGDVLIKEAMELDRDIMDRVEIALLK